jgi:hypothetical protein
MTFPPLCAPSTTAFVPFDATCLTEAAGPVPPELADRLREPAGVREPLRAAADCRFLAALLPLRC